jgi:putative transposase
MEVKTDLIDMLERYRKYKWTKKAICRMWGISGQRFYVKNSDTRSGIKKIQPVQLTRITDKEKQAVINYALTHTVLNHREMSYRMIDENVAYMSSSSVYRILRENKLIFRKGKRPKPEKWNPHQKLIKPNELWQTDLMNFSYQGRDYYSLSYIDVYSRYLVYQKLLSSMTGNTIKEQTEQAISITKVKPTAVQSDNGSCYISQEYRSCLGKMEIEHHLIHPHCPNENAEIERYHRTIRELVDPNEAKCFEGLEKIIKERIHYYNHERYHSSIGYITPYAKYTGKAEKIFIERQKKINKAKDRRIKENYKQLIKAENNKQKAA